MFSPSQLGQGKERGSMPEPTSLVFHIKHACNVRNTLSDTQTQVLPTHTHFPAPSLLTLHLRSLLSAAPYYHTL